MLELVQPFLHKDEEFEAQKREATSPKPLAMMHGELW